MRRAVAVLNLSLLFCCDGKIAGGPPWIIAVTGDDLSTSVDNPFFRLEEGATWSYERATEEGLERTVAEVLSETKEVWGTRARGVRNTVTLDGEPLEERLDWYAQDMEGSVWFLARESCQYSEDLCVKSAGSWQAGVDGALPGIIMQASPRVGGTYYQQYVEGQAEDEATVMTLDAAAMVPAGNFGGCVRTRDTSALAPERIAHKTYCSGIGLVLDDEGDERAELIDYDPGPRN